jgi:hypothetical protein
VRKETFLPVGAPDSLRVDVVALDHAIECFAIDGEYARGGLFVAACVLQYFRNVTSFNRR